YRMRDALDAPDITPDPVLSSEGRYLVALEGTVMRALSGDYSSRADRIFDAIRQDPQRPVPATTEKDPAMTQPGLRSGPGLAESDTKGAGGVGRVPDQRASTTDATEFGPPPPLLRDILTERESEERVPAVWGDIPPRNPLFTGREDLLDK